MERLHKKMNNRQIDHVLVNQEFFKSIDDCKASNLGIASDHSGIMLRLSLKCTRKTHESHKKTTKWENLMQNEKRIEFNNAINNIINDNPNLNDFCDAMNRAGKSVLSVEEKEDCGWHNLSKAMLRSLFKRRN